MNLADHVMKNEFFSVSCIKIRHTLEFIYNSTFRSHNT